MLEVILPQTAQVVNQQNLSNAARESLLKTEPKAAYILDLIDLLGYERGYVFTYRLLRADCDRLGIAVSNRLLREALRVYPGDRRTYPMRQRGRPEVYYVVPCYITFHRSLGLPDDKLYPSDTLRAADFVSLTAYRVGLHRAFIERCPGQHARGWLADRLGVSKATSRRYDRRARVRASQRYQYYPAGFFPSVTKQYQYFYEAERDAERLLLPLKHELALIYQARGYSVRLVRQVFSHFTLAA